MYTVGTTGVLFWAGVILIISAVIIWITRRLKWEFSAGVALLGVVLTATQIFQSAASGEKPAPSATPSSVPSSLPSSSLPAESMTGNEIRATRASYAGLCMAVKGDTVVTAECTGANSELWTADGMGRIVNSDGQCMDSAGAGGGQPLLVTSCAASGTQEWHFANGLIVSGKLCLTIWGPYTTPGTRIQTWNTQQDPALADEMYWQLT